MLIAQLTDLHIGRPGQLIYGAVDTAAYLQAAITRLNELTPRPDLVLISGDLVDRGTLEEYEQLRTLLEPLQIPARMIIGNHDNRETFLRVFGNLDYLQGAGDRVNYVIDTPTLRLYMLDSAVQGYAYGRLSDETLGWLDAQLAGNPDTPSMIVMHHPPFETGIWWMDALGLHDNAKLEKVVRRHPQIRRILSGHVHRPIFTEWAGVLCSVAPSTAHHVTLDLDDHAMYQMTLEPQFIHLHQLRADSSIVTHACSLVPPTDSFLPAGYVAENLEDRRQVLKQLLDDKMGSQDHAAQMESAGVR